MKLTPFFHISYIKGKSRDRETFDEGSPIISFNLIDDDFVENTSLLAKTLFVIASTTIARTKYYHAWLLSDAICNASGLGFNGYDKDHQPKWDLISNVDIIKFEVRLILVDMME